MIRTLSDLLRLYGDRTITHGPTASGDGRRTVITFEIDHPGECLRCEGRGKTLRCHMVTVCTACWGSGLALDIGGEG